MVSTEQVNVKTRPRILTVCIGSFGRMVGRQIKRTMKNALCIVPDISGDLQLDSPEIKSRIVRSDVIFLVLDVRDSLSLSSAKRLIEGVIPGNTPRGILTWDLAEDRAEEPHVRLRNDFTLPCACLVASPLSLGPSHEELLDKFGIERVATWLICNFVKKIHDRISDNGNQHDEFINLDKALDQGGLIYLRGDDIGISDT